MYIEKMGRPHEKLDYHELAILTTNYVSADIEAICDEVARDASRNLLDLIDEAESGALTEKHLENHKNHDGKCCAKPFWKCRPASKWLI